MFPGETEEDLITTLTKNNFDLETSVNQFLSSEEDEGILIILYFESGWHKYRKTFLYMDEVIDVILTTSYPLMHCTSGREVELKKLITEEKLYMLLLNFLI